MPPLQQAVAEWIIELSRFEKRHGRSPVFETNTLLCIGIKGVILHFGNRSRLHYVGVTLKYMLLHEWKKFLIWRSSRVAYKPFIWKFAVSTLSKTSRKYDAMLRNIKSNSGEICRVTFGRKLLLFFGNSSVGYFAIDVCSCSRAV